MPIFHDGTGPRRKPSRRRYVSWLLFAVATFLVVYTIETLSQPGPDTRDVTLVTGAPVIAAPERHGRWAQADYQIRPVSSYVGRGLVLAVQRWPDPSRTFITHAAAIGWQGLSNPAQVRGFDFHVSGDAYAANGVDPGQLREQSDHLIIIPANRYISDFLDAQLSVGTVVRLEGTLVAIEGREQTWETGTGPGETKILWVHHAVQD